MSTCCGEPLANHECPRKVAALEAKLGEARRKTPEGYQQMSKALDYAAWQRDSLKAQIKEAQAIAKKAVDIGLAQANEWDRFWAALGVLSADITVDQAIEKWRLVEKERDELRAQAAELRGFLDASIKDTEYFQARIKELEVRLEEQHALLKRRQDGVVQGVEAYHKQIKELEAKLAEQTEDVARVDAYEEAMRKAQAHVAALAAALEKMRVHSCGCLDDETINPDLARLVEVEKELKDAVKHHLEFGDPRSMFRLRTASSALDALEKKA